MRAGAGSAVPHSHYDPKPTRPTTRRYHTDYIDHTEHTDTWRNYKTTMRRCTRRRCKILLQASQRQARPRRRGADASERKRDCWLDSGTTMPSYELYMTCGGGVGAVGSGHEHGLQCPSSAASADSVLIAIQARPRIGPAPPGLRVLRGTTRRDKNLPLRDIHCWPATFDARSSPSVDSTGREASRGDLSHGSSEPGSRARQPAPGRGG